MDGYETHAVDVATSKIVMQELQLQRNPLEIKVGESIYTDEMATTRIRLDTTYPEGEINLSYRMGDRVEVLTAERSVTLEDSYKFGNPSVSGILGYDLVKFTGLNAGEAKIKVTSEALGTSKTLTIKVLPLSISETTVSGIKSSYTETGKAIKPTPKVVYNGETLVKGADYSVTYSSNVKAGTALVKITGKGNYTGTVTKKFTIKHEHNYGEWVRWDVARHVSYCTLDESHRKFEDHEWDNGTITKEATERATGTKTFTCEKCGATKTETIPRLSHSHSLTKTAAKAATCTVAGNKAYWTCKGCGKVFSDAKATKETTVAEMRIEAKGHNYGSWTMLNKNKHQKVCKNDSSHVVTANHEWNSGKITKKATETQEGIKTFTCTVCKGTKTESIPKLEPQKVEKAIRRAFGASRYETSFAISDVYLVDSGRFSGYESLTLSNRKATLDNIVVACGTNFPDALAASYFASVKKAPVIVWRDKYNTAVQNYIKANLKLGGMVYIMGGTGAVDSTIANGLSGYKFKRLGGENRYETNVKILNAAKVSGGEILVCDGTNFENALIASATGQPVLLVKPGGVTREGLAFVSGLSNPTFTIIGNEKSVSSNVETQLKAYGSVSRVAGSNPDQVSVNVAKKYFTNPKEVMVATSNDFADGLCGGILAIKNNAPLMLVTERKCSKSVAYTKTLKNLERVTAFGGVAVVPNALAKKLLNTSDKIDTIEFFKKNDGVLAIGSAEV